MSQTRTVSQKRCSTGPIFPTQNNNHNTHNRQNLGRLTNEKTEKNKIIKIKNKRGVINTSLLNWLYDKKIIKHNFMPKKLPNPDKMDKLLKLT